MRCTRTFLLAAAVSLGLAVSSGLNEVQGAIIFSEDFSSAIFGGKIVNDPVFERSERGPGSYHSVTLPSGPPPWTKLPSPTSGNNFQAAQVFGFLRFETGGPGNKAILLDNDGIDPNGISRTITGLLPGVGQVLSFEYWGDNIRGPSPFSYSFSFELTGITPVDDPIEVLATHSGDNMGAFNTHSFYFTPPEGTTTTTLIFKELNGTSVASPVIDNITISDVPEPSSLVVFALGGAGLLVLGRRRAGGSRRRS